MCGIAAVIGKKNTQELTSILESIKHRGEANYFNESVSFDNACLGMNRLAIVDEEHAQQPIFSEDGRYACVLNGEIYNYKDLQTDLKNEGVTFKTNSDTEVLVNGYAKWGAEKLLECVRGMYAFMVFDTQTSEFFAARDAIGIKPLYWAQVGKRFYFSSEIKGLTHFKDVEEIKLFPPAHYMKNGKLIRFWDMPSRDIDKVSMRVRGLFDQAVKRRVDTDLPIAVYLSGGIDSTAVLATAQKYHNDITAIIVGNEDSEDRKVATRYCKENNITFCIKETPSEEELLENIPNVIRIVESFEPNLIRQSSIAYYVAQTAADEGFKVVLCGEGADEIFGGYPESSLAESDDEEFEVMTRFLSDLHRSQLQRVDRTSMHFTTEVRVPFLDRDLLDYVLTLPAKGIKILKKNDEIVAKYVLRKAMSDRLPDYIVNRKKVVFSEGAGYKGNHPTEGLFSNLLSQKVSDEEFNFYITKYHDWNLKTKEEVFYFKEFVKNNYHKATFNKERMATNKIHTL